MKFINIHFLCTNKENESKENCPAGEKQIKMPVNLKLLLKVFINEIY